MADIRFAVHRLLSLYPLHGAVVAQWKMIADPSVGTMCVGLSGPRIVLRYAPEFVETLTVDECCGVLAHEVAHILGEHIWLDPKQFRNTNALLVATEVTANEYITLPLPSRPILLSDFPMLPVDEDATTRYERLAGEEQGAPEPTDCHDWESLRMNETIARAVIGSTAGKALRCLTEKQRAECSPKLLKQAQQAADEVLVASSSKAQVDWRKQLRAYIGRKLARKPSFSRPPRRYPEMVGIVPAQVWRSGRAVVMAVIDTSGSITDEMLSSISAELSSMNRTHEVIVVECDDQIRAAYPFRPVTSVSGRGGTDLRPPLEPDFLRQHRADLVVYFTDGYGAVPDRQPAVPVVWCIVPHGQKPTSWGREVRLKEAVSVPMSAFSVRKGRISGRTTCRTA